MTYRIDLTTAATRQIKKLPRVARDRVGGRSQNQECSHGRTDNVSAFHSPRSRAVTTTTPLLRRGTACLPGCLRRRLRVARANGWPP